MPNPRRYKLTPEEVTHFEHLEYTKQYIDDSLKQFMETIIKKRIEFEPREGHDMHWKIEDDEVIITEVASQ